MNNTTNNIKTTPLYNTIKSIIDAADPERLLSSGAPENEYDNESAKIAGLLTPDMTMPQIAKAVCDVMNRSFATGFDVETGEEDYLPGRAPEYYFGVAIDIYKALVALIDLSSGKPEFRAEEPSGDRPLPDAVWAEDGCPLPDPDRVTELTHWEMIDEMFSETEADGTYYGFEPYSDYCESRLMQYKLSWTEADRDHIKAEFTMLSAALRECAERGEALPGCERYLAPLEHDIDYGFLTELGIVDIADADIPGLCEEAMDSILTKMEYGEELSESEQAAYAQYRDALDKEAAGRIGEGLYSSSVIRFAQRYNKLISLSAPKVVIDNEARNLAQAMVYHEFADPKALHAWDYNKDSREPLDLKYLDGYHEQTLEDVLEAYE
ncbi:MAG: hypothetical protein J5535_05905 [Firmicutes bacterium]|nr:hypothetical protein [Bacillota bacterium]